MALEKLLSAGLDLPSCQKSQQGGLGYYGSGRLVHWVLNLQQMVFRRLTDPPNNRRQCKLIKLMQENHEHLGSSLNRQLIFTDCTQHQ